MKYRMALSLAVACEWIDERVLGHAERWFPLWVPVRYPFCEWSYRLHEWAAEISGADFLEEEDELDSE